ncbi:MAG: hybrid sensor histidine kinase/response regulator [Chloroflexi bacterium]|nr:hybrid sensor histidine kinase/response regulator [Chloroflexota bacterium]
MWQALHLSRQTNADFVTSAEELGRRTSARLIIAVGFLYLVWHLVATLWWPGGIGWTVWFISPLVVGTCALSWRLLRQRYLLAQGVWQIGLILSITLALLLFQQSRIAYLYALMPLMVVISVGWPAAILVEAVLALLLLPLYGGVSLLPVPVDEAVQVLIAGAVTGLLGWTASDSLLMVTHWSLSSYTQAREAMDEAMQHRGQLARVLKDLDQAYHRLQRSNAALVAAWKVAAEAERFKAEFATHISHELRTPLNLIAGFTEMMMTSPESYDRTPLPGAYRRDLDAVYRSAQHLLALVDDVIDLARIDAGKIVLSREEVDLAVLIKEATDMVRDYVAAKGLHLDVEITNDLPRLWLDRLRIRQVLLNLLVNAARFTEHGSIHVSAACEGDEVVVRVTDTGRGIPAPELPRIFEDFRTQDDTGESHWVWHSGTGLGLPISKRFVDLHHGQMGVESVYLHGTTIWFTLPCTPAPGRAVPGGTDAQGIGQRTTELLPRRPAPRHAAGERIIIAVHEDSQLAPFLQRHLDGYRVVGAVDANECLALVEELKPVAVVMEQGPLGTGVGYNAPSSLKRAPFRGNAFSLAAPQMNGTSLGEMTVVRCALPSNLNVARELGVRELLTKPVSREQLFAALDRLDRPVKRVLVVDDDPEMVRMIQRMLVARLCEQDCLEAYDGAEALQLMRQQPIDLVFLDLKMPNLDGRELLRQMAGDPHLSAIPVIVISAQAQDGSADPLPGDIQITHGHGFRLGELVATLQAVCDALAPGWS